MEQNVKNIFNWYKDNTSFPVLNMPFEANNGNEDTETKDYTEFENNGTIEGPTWNSAGGYDGWGAYEFNGTSLLPLNP